MRRKQCPDGLREIGIEDRRLRRRAPHVPVGFIRNGLGQLVRAPSDSPASPPSRRWHDHEVDDVTTYTVHAVRDAAKRALTTPGASGSKFQAAFEILFGYRPDRNEWARLLMGEVRRLKLRALEMAGLEAEGYVERLLWRAQDIVVSPAAGGMEVRLKRAEVPPWIVSAEQVRSCVGVFGGLGNRELAAGDKRGGNGRLRSGEKIPFVRKGLPATRLELESFLSNTAASEVVVALVERGRGRYVAVDALARDDRDSNELQRLRVRELLRVDHRMTERAVLVLLTRKDLLAREELLPDDILRRIDGKLPTSMQMPEYVNQASLVVFLSERLALGRGGGRDKELSEAELRAIVQEPARLLELLKATPRGSVYRQVIPKVRDAMKAQ